jgi:hypothetical protein
MKIKMHIAYLVLAGTLVTLVACGSRSPSNSTPPPTTSATDDIARAQQLYAQRQDLMRIREAIVYLRQATTKDPGSYDASWQLAKYNYYLASHTDNSNERDKAFQDGIDAGEVAIKLQGDKPDGHFWLGANYGGAAQFQPSKVSRPLATSGTRWKPCFGSMRTTKMVVLTWCLVCFT